MKWESCNSISSVLHRSRPRPHSLSCGSRQKCCRGFRCARWCQAWLYRLGIENALQSRAHHLAKGYTNRLCSSWWYSGIDGICSWIGLQLVRRPKRCGDSLDKFAQNMRIFDLYYLLSRLLSPLEQVPHKSRFSHLVGTSLEFLRCWEDCWYLRGRTPLRSVYLRTRKPSAYYQYQLI